MNLFTVCKSCREQSIVKSNASDRLELMKEKGEEFNIQCSKCLKNHKIHVNDVRASVDKKILIGGLIIGLIVTVFLLSFVGLIGTITLSIPAIIWKQQSDSVHLFNKHITRRS